jgi:hypothetical protein
MSDTESVDGGQIAISDTESVDGGQIAMSDTEAWTADR